MTTVRDTEKPRRGAVSDVREIGPMGTAARLCVGAALLASVVYGR